MVAVVLQGSALFRNNNNIFRTRGNSPSCNSWEELLSFLYSNYDSPSSRLWFYYRPLPHRLSQSHVGEPNKNHTWALGSYLWQCLKSRGVDYSYLRLGLGWRTYSNLHNCNQVNCILCSLLRLPFCNLINPPSSPSSRFDAVRRCWRGGLLYADQSARVDGPGDGAQEEKTVLEIPNAGAGEGVPVQRIRVQAEALGVGPQLKPHRATGM